jgi:predicted RNA-binding Zn-ribbon protein involved in translation (DUF1610 family)
MDADLKAELDAAADAAMSEYQTQDSRERALSLKPVLTDGICRIVDVQDQLHPPCVGLIHTDLGEKFPVFDIFTREQAKTLNGQRVKLRIQMSRRGTRYVTGMMALPIDGRSEYWVCPRCGQPSQRVLVGASNSSDFRWIYRCTSCAYQMEVGA